MPLSNDVPHDLCIGLVVAFHGQQKADQYMASITITTYIITVSG